MMRNYNPRDTKTVDELDPCIAAEVRMKNDALFQKSNRLKIILIAIALALICLAAIFLIIFFALSSSSSEASTGKSNGSARVKQSGMGNNDIYEESLPSRAHGDVIANSDPLDPPKADDPIIPMATPANIDSSTFIEVVSNRSFAEFPIDAITTTTSAPPSEQSTMKFEHITPRNRPVTSTTEPSMRPSSSTIVPTKPTEPAVTITYATKSDDLPEILPSIADIDGHKYDFIETDDIFEDCNQYRKAGHDQSGVYEFDVKGLKFTALCLMEPDHSWMALQRRTNGGLSFNRTFEEYSNGFGHPTTEHWLGLEKVYTYIKQGQKLQLRIELRGDFCSQCSKLNETGFWFGDWDFEIGSRENKYKLSISKILKGNLSEASNDNFHFMNNGRFFTTYDQDNDNKEGLNCANFKYFGPWWHHDCTYVALNGKYGMNTRVSRGMSWYYDFRQDGPNNARNSYYLKPQLSIMKFRIK